jgi:hypothetical protein
VRELKLSVPLAPVRGREARSDGAVHAVAIPEERLKRRARYRKEA